MFEVGIGVVLATVLHSPFIHGTPQNLSVSKF